MNNTRLVTVLVMLLSAIPGYSQSKEMDRLEVLSEILNVPEDIPRDLLNKADCVIVLPSVVK